MACSLQSRPQLCNSRSGLNRGAQQEGRPSIPPEQLLSALLLQVLYSVRSERQLMEQLDGFARRTLECPRCQRRIIEVIELEKAAS